MEEGKNEAMQKDVEKKMYEDNEVVRNKAEKEKEGKNDAVEEAVAAENVCLKKTEEEKNKRNEVKKKAKQGRVEKAQRLMEEAKKIALERGQTRQASHILIKYRPSKDSGHMPRKSAWNDPNGILIGQRTEEEAVALLADLRSQVNAGTATFEELAREHSNCASAKNGGNLGTFVNHEYHQVDQIFTETLFSLEVGEISAVKTSKSGVYIMQRTA